MAKGKHILAKARGFTISIEKMNEHERNRLPSVNFGEDYNRLREEALSIFPALNSMMPPPAEVKPASSGEMYCYTKFNEIDTYCEQIYQLVSGVTD